MANSKYSTKPTVTDAMVTATVRWIDESLVEYIPEMLRYPVFSAKLLQVALVSSGIDAWRRLKDENIMRAMEFLADPAIAEMPAELTDPDIVRDLLTYAVNGNQVIRVITSVPMNEDALTDVGTAAPD